MSRKLFLALLLGSLIVLAKVSAEQEADAEVDVEVDDEDDDDADEVPVERAVLLVRRTVADKRPLEGKQTTVTISIYNAGNTSASNVKLTEAAWPLEGFNVEGDLTASFDTIPSGSSVTHTYKVAGKEAGVYRQAPTVVSYTPAEEEAEQTVTTFSLTFRTYTIVESITEQALEYGSIATGGSFNTVADWQRLGYLVAAGAVALIGYRSYGSFAASHANRKRAKALAALGESEKDK